MTGQRAAAAREQPEAVVQAGGHAIDTERDDARRGELDRERDPVEAPANGGRRRRDAALGNVPWLGGTCPRHEEPDRAVPEDVFHVLVVFRWHIEWRDPVDVLAGDSQRLAAGRQQRDAGAGAQQCLGHAGGRLDHVLTVVDDQQELPGADRARDTFVRHGARNVREAERTRHSGRDKLRTRQGAELGDEYAIGKSRQKVPRDLQAQSRLADAAGADQADQSMFGGQGRDFCEFDLSTDQFRHRLRKVRHPRGRRTSGRGSRRADFARELIAASGHRPDEVAIGAKELSEHGDLSRQVVFLDDPVRPHAAHELVLTEDLAASVDEGQQRIERATAELDRSTIGQ